MRAYRGRTTAALCLALTLAAAGPCPAALGAGPTVLSTGQLLTAGDGVTEERAGSSVAVRGDWLAIGAPNGYSDAGAVYVATRSGSGWAVTQRLVAPDAAMYDMFGVSVAMCGDTLVVGASGRASERGAAYVFVRSGMQWVYSATLTASDGATMHRFGEAVSIDAGTIVVGAPGVNSHAGRAYVFVWTGSGWAEQGKLTATDATANDYFGRAVAIRGDTALIGSPLDDTLSSDGGSAYVFTRSGSAWTQRTEIVSVSSDPGDWFGSSVALSDGTALIGAALDDTPTVSNCGKAYVYVGSGPTWSHQATLQQPTPTSAAMFGASVALDADLALVGAPQATYSGPYSGGAYYYLRSGTAWSAASTLIHASMTSYSDLGQSVAVSETTGVAGSPRFGDYRGAAYVFHNPATVVHRFYRWTSGTHFYTDNAVEAFGVQSTLSHLYAYEGGAYRLDPAKNTQPLFRFYRPGTASHFYTADPAERDRVLATLAQVYAYDGPTYAVSPVPDAGRLPVYRFFHRRNGSHFYTADETEKEHVISALSGTYQYEGPAFWLGQ